MEVTYQTSLNLKALAFNRLKVVEDLVYWLNYATQTQEPHAREWALMKADTTRSLLKEILEETRSLKCE
jgi:hypothetical protein